MRIKNVEVNLNHITVSFWHLVIKRVFSVLLYCFFTFSLTITQGSLGARINELKQRVIAENPHRYGIAVPRKSAYSFSEHKASVASYCLRNFSVLLLFLIGDYENLIAYIYPDRHHSSQEEP